jgi:hypothetical protein
MTLLCNVAADRFLYIEPDPGGAIGSQHVTLDLADLLTNFSAAARAARRGGGYRPLAAGLLPAGEGVINVEDDDSDDDDIAELSLLGAAAWAAAAGQSSGASSSSSSNNPPQQRQQQQQRPNSGASSSGKIMPGSGSGPADVASAEADLAALESMDYEPPDNMQVRVCTRFGMLLRTKCLA